MNGFGLHKIWFSYTDEWIITSDVLAECIGNYKTLEEARQAKKKYDRESFKKISSYDIIRDLNGFGNNDQSHDYEAKLVEYARSQGWTKNIKEQYDSGNKKYYEVAIPPNATDEQYDTILELAGAYFHRIIEYKEVKRQAHVKLNYDFWGKKVFDQLKTNGLIETRSTPEKGYYLLNKPPKGRKSAKFSDVDLAWETAVKILFQCLIDFPENSFLGKTYVDDWSDQPKLMNAYLESCTSFVITKEKVTSWNQKALQAKVKKLKSNVVLTEGDIFTSVEYVSPDKLVSAEVKGFIEFLKIKPFSVFTSITEVNGEGVKSYYADHSTL